MTGKSTGNKSAGAFRTISEVATRLGVPKHVLRFWEGKFPQVKPMKRGGGRRYYRPEDIDLLQGIRVLLHSEGYTIKGVQKILREQGVQYVKDCAQLDSGELDSSEKGDGRRGAGKERSEKRAIKTSGVALPDAVRTNSQVGSSSARAQGAGAKPQRDSQGQMPPHLSGGKETRKALIAAQTAAQAPSHLNTYQRNAIVACITQLEDCRTMLRGAALADQSIGSATAIDGSETRKLA